jgi:hypothetical protein
MIDSGCFKVVYSLKGILLFFNEVMVYEKKRNKKIGMMTHV